MKVLIYISVLFIASCNSEVAPTPKEGLEKIAAVYTASDSSKVLDIMLRQITKTIKYDSVNKKDIISLDTLWGYPALTPLRDSLGRTILDSNKNVKKGIGYVVIHKDSVNWRIENKNVDSLLKK